jgi:hypothetical protein
MTEMGMILRNHQQEIVEMKNVLVAQTWTIVSQSTMIVGLSEQVQNLQVAVDPVGWFADCPIVVEDDDEDREEDQSMVTKEHVWTRGPNINSLVILID